MKKRKLYQVNHQNLVNPFSKNNKKELDSVEKFVKQSGEKSSHASISIESALSIIVRQMKTDGNRERTINDYVRQWNLYKIDSLIGFIFYLSHYFKSTEKITFSNDEEKYTELETLYVKSTENRKLYNTIAKNKAKKKHSLS